MKVAIAEDSGVIRDGIARQLEENGHEVVLRVGSGLELLAYLERPDTPAVDIVVMDIRMPPTRTDEGVRTALELRRRRPGMPVLALSAFTQTNYALELLSEGSNGIGYLLKDHIDEIGVLLDALERLVRGESVVDPQIVDRLMRANRRAAAQTFTEAERAVLVLMAEGLSNNGIAARLVLAPKTVEGHVTNIYNRLGIGSERDENRRVMAVLSWLRILDHA